jgi:O-antigen/teichoic acid export membrane protein
MISDPHNDESKTLGNILGLRLTSALVFMSLAPLVAWIFPYPLIIKIGILIMALAFLFNQLTSILIGVFQKYLATSKTALAELTNKLVMFVLTALAIFLKQGFLIIILPSIIAGAINFFLLFYFAKRYIAFSFNFQFSEWKKIILRTWPIALTIALNLVYFKADTIILSVFRSPAEVGIYGAPYRILEVLINFSYLFLGLLLPLMTSYYAVKNIEGLKDIIQKGFNVLIIFTIPMIFGIYFLGVPIMVLIAGSRFVISGILLKILVLATAAIFIASLFGYAVVAIQKQKQMIKFYLANAIISLAAYLIFIPIYGYWAAAWLTVISEGFILLTAFWIVYKNLKFVPDLKILGKATFASLVMSAPLFFFPALNLFLQIGVASVIYFGVMYIIKGFSKGLILEIIKRN